ncbi:MAG TPA: DUF86 domain-containing protein [Ignavibacteria bacterium]|nr:DUF86 domain-containing protein [Ignavibacteria bacterium]
MSEREWKLYIKDIVECINKINDYIGKMSKEEFLNDDKTFDAVMRNLEIIGEAVKLIPSSVKEEYGSIEWKKIAGLRDIIIHGYFGINADLIWNVITEKIPELKSKIDIVAGELGIE